MRINELILEQQLDELNLKGLGTGLGKAAGAVAGGVVQGAKNMWAGAKQGYDAAQQALKPDGTPATSAPTQQPNTSTAPASPQQPAGGEVASNNLLQRAQQGTTQDLNAQPATQAPTAGTTPQQAAAQDQQAKIGVGQINKIIPTLRTRDLQSVKKNVDATIAKKSKQPAAPVQPPAPTQAELDADHARMASGTNESKVIQFRSKFLGIDI